MPPQQRRQEKRKPTQQVQLREAGDAPPVQGPESQNEAMRPLAAAYASRIEDDMRAGGKEWTRNQVNKRVEPPAFGPKTKPGLSLARKLDKERTGPPSVQEAGQESPAAPSPTPAPKPKKRSISSDSDIANEVYRMYKAGKLTPKREEPKSSPVAKQAKEQPAVSIVTPPALAKAVAGQSPEDWFKSLPDWEKIYPAPKKRNRVSPLRTGE